MEKTIIKIPRLNDRRHDFHSIYKILDTSLIATGEIHFDLSGCDFLKHNAVSFLTGLILLLHSRNRTVYLDPRKIQPKVFENLRQNGFLELFGGALAARSTNSVPVRHFLGLNEEEKIVDYLINRWIKKGWLSVGKDLSGTIVGNIWEIFANSFEHSNCAVGLIVCGQHYPTKRQLGLSMIDFGVGIPVRVRKFLDSPALSAAECLSWAIKSGNSTRIGSPGGLGLDMLKDFIRLNNGELSVYSGDGFFRWFGYDQEFGTMPSYFRGTMVNVMLRCDGMHYDLR
jgi:hypothetical protein